MIGPVSSKTVLTCRVVGLGGIGQIVATYLTLYLASRKQDARVVLIDGDRFEEQNETRMFFEGFDNKASAVQADLVDRLPPGRATIVAVPEYVGEANIERLIPGGPHEAVLLCVDNHATRKLVADHAAALADVCVISGGNDGVGPESSGAVRAGTAGNVQVFMRCAGHDRTPTLTKYHPEIADPADKRPDEQSCAELVATGSQPQILFTNLMAAAWMLSTYRLWLTGDLVYSELVFDVAKGRAAPLALPSPAMA